MSSEYGTEPEGVNMDKVRVSENIPSRKQAAWTAGSCPVPDGNSVNSFLLKEIYEQPRAVMDTITEWIDDTEGLLRELGLKHGINNIRRLHMVGCGTSYHAGLIGRYIIEKFVHIPVIVDIASEYGYLRPNIPKGTCFIGISQSGETPDTVEAQRDARKKGAVVIAVCNVAGSTATHEADAVLRTRAGQERGGASTKAFSAQLAALCLLGIALGIKKRTLHDIEVETLRSLVFNLPDLIARVLESDRKISDISRTLLSSRGFVYLGRGISYPVAIEGALKMKELSNIHAEGYPTGQMKFGPLALIGDGAPVIYLCPIESLDNDILHDITRVKTMGGRVIVITDSPALMNGIADDVIAVPTVHPALSPFVTVVPLQLLAYRIAAVKCTAMSLQSPLCPS